MNRRMMLAAIYGSILIGFAAVVALAAHFATPRKDEEGAER